MSIPIAPYIVGPPIESPGNFYGRQSEVDRFFAHLNGPQAQPLQVIGIRRSGKTSFLKYISHSEILRRKVKDVGNTLVAYVDLQAEIKSPSDFYAAVATAIARQMVSEKYTQLPDQFPTKRSFDRWLNSPELINHRLIILLDEFEALRENNAFDLDFFKSLRSLVGGRLAWVTTSFRDLYRLSRKMGHDEKTSPFFNVFHPTPLVLGPMSLVEAKMLISGPAKDYDIHFSSEALEAILDLAGPLPFFLQATAEKWISESYCNWSVQMIKRDVRQQLLREMTHHFDWYWLHFTTEEKEWLHLAAIDRLPHDINILRLRETDEALYDLFRYGLLISVNDATRIASHVFSAWIIRQSEESFSPFSKGENVMQKEKSEFFKAQALLIGVGDYILPRFTSLPATIRDAQAIATVLTDQNRCGYSSSKVQVITGDQATAPNIRTALQTLAQSSTAQSTVFIYFSGHGGRALENSAWRTYLCPREANPDNLAKTAIPGDEFSALLATIPAQKMLVILDACHAGGSAELKATDGATVWKSGLPDDYFEALSRGSGRVVIASSKADQYSYVRKQGDLSLFTWHLREALSGKAAVRGDGLIHVLDVFHYVNEAVQADETKQTPILKVKDLDLNFPIALDRGGKGAGGPAISMTPISDIREQLVRDPLNGAKALSEHLGTRPEWFGKRDEVDLKRADLERIQHELDLFGPDESNKAAKNRVVYFLLRVCFEIEISVGNTPPSNKSDTETGRSTQMDFKQKVELVNALLACPTMRDRHTRDAVVNDLPDNIRNNIQRNSVDRVDVGNIVNRCLDYPNGLGELIEIIRFYESNSIGMQRVDELLN